MQVSYGNGNDDNDIELCFPLGFSMNINAFWFVCFFIISISLHGVSSWHFYFLFSFNFKETKWKFWLSCTVEISGSFKNGGKYQISGWREYRDLQIQDITIKCLHVYGEKKITGIMYTLTIKYWDIFKC